MRKTLGGLAAGLSLLALHSPSASAQPAESCQARFDHSMALMDVVNKGFDAIRDKDTKSYPAALAAAEAEFNKLPSSEVKAELCTDHINAYTSHQYQALSALRAKGADTGFPANLPLVKQPELNQSLLPYVVGWIKFEQGNFAGALQAYGKGLDMFPNQHDLQQEYIATLIQLKRNKDVIAFTDKILNNTYDHDDATRSKIFMARGLAFYLDNNLTDAKEALTVASRYNSTDEVQDYLDTVEDALAKAKKN